MTKLPNDDILKLYASLMSEVKARLSAVDSNLVAIQKMKDQVQLTFAMEFCYLQLRRVTELVSLGVLLAHNYHEDYRTSDLLKEWNAGSLLRQLSKLTPSAFPQPAPIFPTGKDGGYYVIKQSKVSEQPREDIGRIYNECGDKLHTGHLRLVLKQRNKAYSFPFLRESMHTLVKMLDEHVIELPSRHLVQASLKLAAPGPVRCQWMDPTRPPQSA